MDLLTLPSLSVLLGCWLDDVTPAIPFILVGGFPLGCKGPQRSLTFPLMGTPSPIPSLSEASRGPRWQSLRGGREDFSYPIPPPLRGAPVSLPSLVWLCGSLQCFLCCDWISSAGLWIFFVVYWRGKISETSLCHDADIWEFFFN